MADKYNIVRMYLRSSSRVIQRRVTLQEAQEHCRSHEATHKTCTSYVGRKRTERMGPWFDGYEAA